MAEFVRDTRIWANAGLYYQTEGPFLFKKTFPNTMEKLLITSREPGKPKLKMHSPSELVPTAKEIRKALLCFVVFL
jgi:hypothetical protein